MRTRGVRARGERTALYSSGDPSSTPKNSSMRSRGRVEERKKKEEEEKEEGGGEEEEEEAVRRRNATASSTPWVSSSSRDPNVPHPPAVTVRRRL